MQNPSTTSHRLLTNSAEPDTLLTVKGKSSSVVAKERNGFIAMRRIVAISPSQFPSMIIQSQWSFFRNTWNALGVATYFEKLKGAVIPSSRNETTGITASRIFNYA